MNRLLVLLFLFTTGLSYGQTNEKLFFQIIEKGKLIKIIEKDDQLKFERIKFNIDEEVFLLAYDKSTSSLCALTNETKTLHRLDLNGNIVSSRVLENVPKNKDYVISAMDEEGNLFLGGFRAKHLLKVNIHTGKVERIRLQTNKLSFFDATYIEEEKALYAITHEGYLIKIIAATGKITKVENVQFEPGTYGSIWRDAENCIYGFNKHTKNLNRYNPTTKEIFCVGKASYHGGYNDGTAVINHKKEAPKPEAINKDELFSVYPNPNYGRFTISLASETPSDKTLSVFNKLGVLIKEQQIEEGVLKIDMDLGNVTAGDYYLTIDAKDERLATKKIVVIKD